jgi:hypothetical protein
MPVLPLSPDFSVIPAGGDLPVTDSSDVLAVLATTMRAAEKAPARDALCSALAAAAIRHQELGGYAAAQCDILRATDQYLVDLAEERGFFQQRDEDQETFRARILAIPNLVTPEAIIDLANAILAPFTSVQCAYFESALDRWFLNNGSATWHSFVGASPGYDDRFYWDPAHPDTTIANRDPGGAWVFGDSNGRMFVLRVPVFGDSDITIGYSGYNDATGQPILLSPGDSAAPELGGAESQTATPDIGSFPATSGGRGMFIANGSNAGGSEADGSCATFLYQGGQTALSVYQSIINSVERIRGQGIRWQLFVDPALV